jgi:hypothetical protein
MEVVRDYVWVKALFGRKREGEGGRTANIYQTRRTKHNTNWKLKQFRELGL